MPAGDQWLNTPRFDDEGVLLAAFRASLAGSPATIVARPDDISPDDAADLGLDGECELPPEAFGWTEAPDPDTGPPDELAELPEEKPQAAPVPVVPEPWPEGIVAPDGFPAAVPPTAGGPGFGFGEGDPLDVAAAGVVLAGLAEDAHQDLGRVDDDNLIGVIRAWRRIGSWAAGRELAAAAELARRRPVDGLPGSGREYVADELAAALTLTVRAACAERDLAWQLATVLPATLAALTGGRIDLAKARVIAQGTAELTPGHAAAVEAAVLPKAPGWTAGQLRAAVARAVLAADPDAAQRGREAAQARAHVSCWSGPAGTGHLEGHDLPAAHTLAADARLTQTALAWKNQGAQGGLDLLRAHAYLALLLGHDTTAPPEGLLHPTRGPHTDDSGPSARDGDGRTSPSVPAGLRAPEPELPSGSGAWPSVPPAAARINLTIPLATWLGRSDAPGEVPGFGPVDPDTARTLATTAAGHPATRWTVTLTSPDGHALGHGTSRPGTGPPGATGPPGGSPPGGSPPGAPGTTGPPGSRPSGTSPPGTSPPGSRSPGSGWTVTIEPIATGTCDHQHEEPGYRPSPTLARLLRARTTTCSFPGCRRPAVQCDLDHTVPYEDGGRTCECNIAPLCRRHHQVKQADGWQLLQPSPGVLVWLTPAGRRYTTLPSQHPT